MGKKQSQPQISTQTTYQQSYQKPHRNFDYFGDDDEFGVDSIHTPRVPPTSNPETNQRQDAIVQNEIHPQQTSTQQQLHQPSSSNLAQDFEQPLSPYNPSDAIAMSRDEHALASWEKYQAKWQQMRERLAKRTKRSVEDLTMTHAENYRETVEARKMASNAVGMWGRHATNAWEMSLRGANERYVVINDLTSTVHEPVSAQEIVHFPSTTKSRSGSPTRSEQQSLVSIGGPKEKGKDQMNNTRTRKFGLETLPPDVLDLLQQSLSKKKMIYPLAMEDEDGGLVVTGESLQVGLKKAEESQKQIQRKREEEEKNAEEKRQKELSLARRSEPDPEQSVQHSECPVTVSNSSVSFLSRVGELATQSVEIKNTGRSCVHFILQHITPPTILTDIPNQPPKVLPTWAVFTANPTRGVLMPQSTVRLTFSFHTPSPGLFADLFYLLCSPPPRGHSDPFAISCAGHALLPKPSIIPLNRLHDEFERDVTARIMRDIISDVVFDVNLIIGPERPIDVEAALFEYQNNDPIGRGLCPVGVMGWCGPSIPSNIRLYSTPSALNYWEKLMGTVWRCIGMNLDVTFEEWRSPEQNEENIPQSEENKEENEDDIDTTGIPGDLWQWHISEAESLILQIPDAEVKEAAQNAFDLLYQYSAFPFISSLADVEGVPPPETLSLNAKADLFIEQKKIEQGEDEQAVPQKLKQDETDFVYPNLPPYDPALLDSMFDNADKLDEVVTPFEAESLYIRRIVTELVDSVPEAAERIASGVEFDYEFDQLLHKHPVNIGGEETSSGASKYYENGGLSTLGRELVTIERVKQQNSELRESWVNEKERLREEADAKEKGTKPKPAKKPAAAPAKDAKGKPGAPKDKTDASPGGDSSWLGIAEIMEMRRLRFNPRHNPLFIQIRTDEQKRNLLEDLGCSDFEIRTDQDIYPQDDSPDDPLPQGLNPLVLNPIPCEDELDGTLVNPLANGGPLNPFVLPRDFFLSFFQNDENPIPTALIPSTEDGSIPLELYSQQTSLVPDTPFSAIEQRKSAQLRERHINGDWRKAPIRQFGLDSLPQKGTFEGDLITEPFTYDRWNKFYTGLLDAIENSNQPLTKEEIKAGVVRKPALEIPPIFHKVSMLVEECEKVALPLHAFAVCLDAMFNSGPFVWFSLEDERKKRSKKDDKNKDKGAPGIGVTELREPSFWVELYQRVFEWHEPKSLVITDEDQNGDEGSEGEEGEEEERAEDESDDGMGSDEGQDKEDGGAVEEEQADEEEEEDSQASYSPYAFRAPPFPSKQDLNLRFATLISPFHWANQFSGHLLHFAFLVQQNVRQAVQQIEYLLSSHNGRPTIENVDRAFIELDALVDGYIAENRLEEEENDDGNDQFDVGDTEWADEDQDAGELDDGATGFDMDGDMDL
ncbi:putative MYCBP-associated protein family protein [Blattamonas nauphoetae]|uniref:MYCBP-associated protein family protein n=1 Tax=Blattamonas nauphoetae TaxID=2049346 RepID=A0ABQ9YL69_9EUKA|nr:putative MYCBP-associated protein family protein [Blattamonas nauphoetae]